MDAFQKTAVGNIWTLSFSDLYLVAPDLKYSEDTEDISQCEGQMVSHGQRLPFDSYIL